MPARIWNLLACMARPLLDTGQFNQVIMYLFIFFLPIIIISLMRSIIPTNPKSRRFLMATILQGTPWPLQGHRGPICCCRKVKMNINNWNSARTTTRHWLRAQLFALTIASLKIGCRVESSLRRLRQSHLFSFHALAKSKETWSAAKSISTWTHFRSALITMPCTAWPTPPIFLTT
jgi:hypothetical protein